MAKLTKDEVEHVAKLANLKLSEKELLRFTKELSSIVEYVGQLGEVDTTGVTPTSQTTGLTNVYREDKVDSSNYLSKEEALSGTDKLSKEQFLVPGILDK